MVFRNSDQRDKWTDGYKLTAYEIGVRFNIPQEEFNAFQTAIRVYKYGATIIYEGEEDHTLFLIRSGRVSVIKKIDEERWEKIGTVEATNFVGEMTLFNDVPRSATVFADSDEVLVYAITRPNLSLIFSNAKWAEMLISRLCRDVSSTNAQIVKLTRANKEFEEKNEHLSRELEQEKQSRQQDLAKISHIVATISHFQRAIFDLSVYGSKSWTYLNAFGQLTMQLTRHFFPDMEIKPDAADRKLLKECLDKQQTILPQTLIEDLMRD